MRKKGKTNQSKNDIMGNGTIFPPNFTLRTVTPNFELASWYLRSIWVWKYQKGPKNANAQQIIGHL